MTGKTSEQANRPAVALKGGGEGTALRDVRGFEPKFCTGEGLRACIDDTSRVS